jgi:hypothetical protein
MPEKVRRPLESLTYLKKLLPFYSIKSNEFLVNARLLVKHLAFRQLGEILVVAVVADNT